MATPGAAPDRPEPLPADPDVPPVEPASPRGAILFAAFVVACVGIVTLTPVRDWVAPLGHLERPPWIDAARDWVRTHGIAGQAAFVLGTALGVAIGVPRLALAFVGGALFGWIEGTLLSQVGAVAGCWATFAVGRRLGHAWVQSLVARRFPRAQSLLAFISRHAFESNVLFRIAPVGNAFATNLLFAVSTATPGTFVVATAVGTFPQTLFVALIGSAAKGTETAPRVLGGSIALVVLGLAAMVWTRRLRARRRTHESG